MNYDLNKIEHTSDKYLKRLVASGIELFSYLDKRKLGFAVFLSILGSIGDIITPYLLGTAIDKYISKSDMHGLIYLILFLLVLSIITNIISYFEQKIIGHESQIALFKLRNTIFEKIQSFPISFFSQNNVGDLMSRLNNDTQKISDFLSQSVAQTVGSLALLLGVGGFILYLNLRLGSVLLASAILLVVFTRLYSPILERKSREASAALGAFTAGVSEQLTNFKAIIAFDRRNFFERSLQDLNEKIYKRSLISEFLSKLMEPIYDSAGNISQIAVLLYGVYLIAHGQVTLGLLIAFITYAVRFYNPLQYFSRLFGEVQTALASWGRIKDVLELTSNVVVLNDNPKTLPVPSDTLTTFENVSFSYDDNSSDENMVLKDIDLTLSKGRTYAVVGPTGGGKSTMASLMTRLYDPVKGTIYWKGRDIRSYERGELSHAISIILQEPYLFSGTMADNIRYGNIELKDSTDEELEKMFKERGLDTLIQRFPEGIKTHVETGGENISIGQKQLISFVRTVLRKPELLILDEATANIDTVTEDILEDLLNKLPKETTKVIIAHRLNTIRKADDILFIGGGTIKEVSDSKEVLELLNIASKA